MRHAKSSWADYQMTDHARPLNKRGKQAAPLIGKLLADEDIVPDCLLASTATRALQTAELVADACLFRGAKHVLRDLYHSSPEEIAEAIRSHGSGDVLLVVAHNPGMEMMVALLSGRSDAMVTAATAHYHVDIAQWDQFTLECSAELQNFWIPRELDSD